MELASILSIAAQPENGNVRLQGDDMTISAGRLEVYLDNDHEWGTVCFDQSQDQRGMAVTVCRQLGYKDVQRYGTIGELG